MRHSFTVIVKTYRTLKPRHDIKAIFYTPCLKKQAPKLWL